MVYAIGGPPRSGKTICAQKLAANLHATYVCTDSVRFGLRRLVSSSDLPALFAAGRFDVETAQTLHSLTASPDVALAQRLEEDAVVWTAVQGLVLEELRQGRDVLVEGAAVHPAAVRRLLDKVEGRAVFVGNTQVGHAATVFRMMQQQQGKENWMLGYSRAFVEALVGLYRREAHRLQEESRQHGFPFVEMRDRQFDRSVAEVLRRLQH